MEKEFMNLLFMVKTLVLALYGGMPLKERQAEEICKELDKIEDRMNELSGGKNVDASESNCNIQNVTRSALEFTLTEIAFTSHNDHGIIKAELPYQYRKMKDWKKGDKVLIQHCG